MFIYIYTRRKDGAKAPSLLDHSDIRFAVFDAKAQHLRSPIRRAKALGLRSPTFDNKAQYLRIPILRC